jgi:hypothetical protein
MAAEPVPADHGRGKERIVRRPPTQLPATSAVEVNTAGRLKSHPPPDLYPVLPIDMTQQRPQPLQPHLVYVVALELVGVVCLVAVLVAR